MRDLPEQLPIVYGRNGSRPKSEMGVVSQQAEFVRRETLSVLDELKAKVEEFVNNVPPMSVDYSTSLCARKDRVSGAGETFE